MNPTLNLRTHILAPKRLEKLMLRDKPVVPPDSVIKTFGNLKGDRIDLVLTQDGEGLCPGSFVLKNGEWAQFFLDTWFDPLYRSYNFQKAEAHALVRLSFSFPLSPPSLLKPHHNPFQTPTQPNQDNQQKTTGTHRPMAPHHPHQTRPHPPTHPQHLQHRHRLPRRRRRPLPGRRFRRPARGLRHRCRPQLRGRIRGHAGEAGGPEDEGGVEGGWVGGDEEDVESRGGG